MTTLDTHLLISAYCQGLFPMPHHETDEIMWYQPDPRAIIPLNNFHASRSLLKKIRKFNWTYTINQSFETIIRGCGEREDTWINEEIKNAYYQLHKDGFAYSLEVREDEEIIGGVYGVSIGKAFFAESKFKTKTDASKAAIYFLVEFLNANHYELLEVQFLTNHLVTLGATEIPLSNYMEMLEKAVSQDKRLQKIER